MLERTESVRRAAAAHTFAGDAEEALEREATNLQAALVWAEANAPDLFVQLVRGAWWFYRRRSRADARLWLERALPRADDASRADILIGLGTVAWDAGDYSRARGLAEEALTARRAEGDEAPLAEALVLAGNAAAGCGDLDRAIRLFEEARELALETKNDWALRFGTFNLADAHLARGDLAVAARWFEEALRLHEASNKTAMAALTRAMLGHVALRSGDDRAAEELLRATVLAVTRGEADPSDLVLALEGLAWVAANRGDLDRAARLLGSADRIRAVEEMPVQETERAARAAVGAALEQTGASFEAAHSEGYAIAEPSAAAAYALAR